MKLGVGMRPTALLTTFVMLIGLTCAAKTQQPAANPEAHPYGTSEFQLGPDDVIEVYVYQEKDLSPTVQVRPDGKISLPLIGELAASGKTVRELEKEIAD